MRSEASKGTLILRAGEPGDSETPPSKDRRKRLGVPGDLVGDVNWNGNPGSDPLVEVRARIGLRKRS